MRRIRRPYFLRSTTPYPGRRPSAPVYKYQVLVLAADGTLLPIMTQGRWRDEGEANAVSTAQNLLGGCPCTAASSQFLGRVTDD